MKFNLIDKYKNQSYNKISSKNASKELTKEEIDENIRQCYNNLKNLRKSFKGKIKVDKIYTNNINQSNKSSTKLEVAIQTSILNSYNTRNQIKDEYIKNKQYINHNNNILKNSSSTSKIREIYQQKPHFEYNPFKNNFNKTPITPTNNNTNLLNKFKNGILPSFIIDINNSYQEINKKNNISYTNNDISNYNQDSYILYLKKKLDEENKKNQNINNEYQDIKNKYEKLIEDNKSLNEKLKLANEQINELEKNQNKEINSDLKEKYEESQKQIDILKNSLLDYQKINNEITNPSYTPSKLSDIELKSILNHKNYEIEIQNLKNQILLFNNSILEKDKIINELNEKLQKTQEENQKLNNQNKEYSDKLFLLYDEITNKDKIILDYQKKKINKKNQNESQENSYFDNLSNLDSNSRIYKKKTLNDFSIEKNKNNKSKKIEEIKLKIPPPLKETVNREKPNRKNKIEELFKENYESRKKIQILNHKLNSFNDIESKYEKILLLNQNYKDDESKNYFNINITPIETLNNLISYEKTNDLVNILNDTEIKFDDVCIFGINNMNLIKFNLKKELFEIISFNDIIYDCDFNDNFYIEGTLIYNVFNGLFILTGKNCDILYFYNNNLNKINKICQFENNHNSGSILLNKEKNKIFIFSGKFNRKVECFDYKEYKIEELPEINIERSNSTYSILNNNIYAFFGFCYPQSIYTQSIEYLNLKNLESWKFISINNEINYNIKNISSICLNDNNTIIILGGIKGDNEYINDKIYEFSINENIINEKDIKNNEKEHKIYFNMETHFSTFYNKEENIYYYIGIDCLNNVHLMNDKGHFHFYFQNN